MFSTRYLGTGPCFATPKLSIRGIGIRETMPPCFVARDEGTDDCLLMVFHATVHVGRAPFSVPCGPGTIALWDSGDGHHYGNPSERWSHSWIHCDGSLVREALSEAGIDSGHPIALSNPARVDRYLLDLHEELTGPLPPNGHIVENTLANLIWEAARSLDQPLTVPIPQPLVAARQTIEAHYDLKLSLESLAHEAHLSPPHFCAEFRRWYGVPPITYLVRRRMEAAATLLRGTALDVGEVGRKVGYADPFHFSKLFKQTFGESPLRFRRGTPR